ncbi:hypothetical protein BVX97_02910 [bacterium E08(2017)]|nr:hypothetical protein BVX97_02910 [bacterium E08(2017)]
MSWSEKVEKKLKELPDKPGCYLMRDAKGKIIYVGKAVSLRKRVQSYFRKATRRSADPKLRSLVHSIDDFDIVVVRNEAEALLTEGRLIKDYRPYYNVMFKDDKRFILLKVDINEPFPKFQTCRLKKDDGALYFGPYISSPAAKETLDFIERKFGLRRCNPRVPDASTYKHCMNDIIRFCSAPCVGKVSFSEYMARVEEACAFLSGKRPQYIRELREEMQAASEKMEFERAAALRDTLFRIEQTIKQSSRIAKTPEMQVKEGREGVKELKKVLGLKKEPHVIEAYDISNISGTYAVASMVCSIDGIARRNRYRRFRIKTIEGADDPGMMGEVIRRRFTRAKEEGGEYPGLVVVDGGITQIRSAVAELEKLGLGDLPVAGLAKKFEEIYYGDDKPLRLARDSRALVILQRLRDEAHRFALDYHRRLRSKRIRESMLDDIPGVGEQRKQILLKHFGSVRQIMKASEDDVAKVKGIGPELAAAVKSALRDA